MVVGEETPDEGAVSVPKKLTIGYFRQDVEEMQGRSVLMKAVALDLFYKKEIDVRAGHPRDDGWRLLQRMDGQLAVSLPSAWRARVPAPTFGGDGFPVLEHRVFISKAR